MAGETSRCAWCGNPVRRSEGHVVEHDGKVTVWHVACVRFDDPCCRWPLPRAVIIETVRRRGGGRVVTA